MLSRKRIGGFTFLELMLVLAILAIVAMTAIPNYKNFKTRQHVSSAAFGIHTDLINARTIAEKEERAVDIIFTQDNNSKFPGSPYKYSIIKDMNNDNVGNASDLTFRDPDGNIPALVGERFITDNYGGGAYVWGTGLTDGSHLQFQSNGKPASTSLTFSNAPKGGYYSLFVSPQKNANVAKYTSEIRVFWDGRVKVINNWDVRKEEY